MRNKTVFSLTFRVYALVVGMALMKIHINHIGAFILKKGLLKSSIK